MSNTDSRTKFTRRRLLGGLGAATVALTSPIWKPATTFGAAGKPYKRFIGIFSANGTIPSAFWPDRSGCLRRSTAPPLRALGTSTGSTNN